MSALTPAQVADGLDDAADYIEEHGWFRVHQEREHRYHDGPGAACALVAIGKTHPDERAPLGRALAASLGLPGQPAGAIPAWNNRPERTKQEVLDAFRLAAKQQRLRSP